MTLGELAYVTCVVSFFSRPPPQCRLRLGIQRILQAWIRQSKGCTHRSACPSGLSLVHCRVTSLILSCSQFTGPNEITMGAHIIAGPSNSVVIDKQSMYWMAGKVNYLRSPNPSYAHSPPSSQWKNTGDGKSKFNTRTF